MPRRRAVWVLGLVLATGGALAPRARAYVRSTVDDNPSVALFWRYRHVRVRPAYDTSRDVPASAMRLVVGRSIATWNVAADPCSDFRLEDAGPPIDIATSLLGGTHDGENRIVFREEDWPEDIPPGTLALTTVVYRRASGQILDADIDLNGLDYFWTDTIEPGRADTDIQNTLTHELGHLLGLAHASDPEATMYRESSPGDLEKRTLAGDDIAGLCFIYPIDRLSPGAPVLPSVPLSSGCAIAPARGSMPALAMIAIALTLVRRRRSC